MKKVKRVLFALGCTIVATLFVMNTLYHEPIDEAFLDDYEEFNAFEQVNAEPPVYTVSEEGVPVGYLVICGHYGYQSEVVMATLVGMDGTVLNVKPYSQD